MAEEEATVPVLHDPSQEWLQSALHVDPNPDKGGIDLSVTEDTALLSSGGPSGILPAESEKGGAISLYEVREGDSLSGIADMFEVSVNTILWANDIKDPATIQPGDTLLILPVSGVRYTIKRGGTLSDVAKLFDADIDEIALFNGIDPTESLAAGTELIIPGGNLAPAKTVAKTSSGSSSVSLPAVKRPASSVVLGDYANPVPSAYVSQGIHGYNGIDLAGIPSGTPVYAALSGTVIVAKAGGGYNGGYGNYVVISHDNGTQTLYAHLSSVAATPGQSIVKGEHLGGVGNTGRSTGNHLHFEVRGAKNPFAQ
ncbi:MAG: M23 family metallopeptidase [Minisyncoccia bacterium]